MARPGPARILPLAFALAAVAGAGAPQDGVSPRQGCAALGRCCPGRDPTCVARGPPRCFCDQACGAPRACCGDYARVCPGVPCVVASWSGWSRCLKPCQVSYRIRRRRILQEPRNGGVPCPRLEERAGCVEYWSRQGTECQQSLVPALITTGHYGKAREERGFLRAQGYCVQFRLGSVPASCGRVRAPHARWTRYLTPGHVVCVRCESPAQDTRSRRCYGDGREAEGTQLLRWQAVGQPECQGTWERLAQLEGCSCPAVHSLVFV